MNQRSQLIDASALEAVGSTPLVPLRRLTPSGGAQVLVKLEYVNPTGSYKDRMALAMIEQAERRGDLRPGMTVVEFTGGSTGSSLAFICALKGYRIHLVSSDAFSMEKRRMMKAFGAEVELVESKGGKITPDLIPRMRERTMEIAASEDVYFTDQFHNADAILGYQGIGREIVEQTGAQVDAFCGAVGTAGMLMGVGQVLREEVPNARVIALEPDTSAVLSGGSPGPHKVEGVGIGSRPPMLDDGYYDDAVAIAEDEARATARLLAKEEGIFGGTSTGLNVLGALTVAKTLTPDETVVTVACDSGLKYLSGTLYEGT